MVRALTLRKPKNFFIDELCQFLRIKSMLPLRNSMPSMMSEEFGTLSLPHDGVRGWGFHGETTHESLLQQ